MVFIISPLTSFSMFWFISGVVINAIAIVLVIANAVYDALTMEYSTGHNNVVNLIGLILGVVVLVAFSVKNSGKLATANVILWVPAAPLVFFFVVFAGYMLIVYNTKGDWK